MGQTCYLGAECNGDYQGGLSSSSTHHRHQHHHPPLPLPARRHIREQEVLNKLAGLVLGHSLDKQAQEVNQEVRLA